MNVLLLDGEVGHALAIVRCLGHAGADVHLVLDDSQAPAKHSRYVRSCHRLPEHTSDAVWLEALRTIVARHDIDVLFAVWEKAGVRAERLRSELERFCAVAPAPSPRQVRLTSDKATFSLLANEHGWPVPVSFVLGSITAQRPPDVPLRYPAILKRAQGEFGRSIWRVESSDAVAAIIRDTTSSEDRFVLQDFVPGCDVDVSVLCRRGEILAATVQRELVSSPQAFKPPLLVRFEPDAKALAAVRTLVRDLKWDGVAHVDLRVDERDGSRKILEVNPRYWGSVLGSLSAGVNFPRLACNAALGQSFEAPVPSRSTYYTRGLAGRTWDERAGWGSFRYGDLRYALRDPLPVFISKWRRLARG